MIYILNTVLKILWWGEFQNERLYMYKENRKGLTPDGANGIWEGKAIIIITIFIWKSTVSVEVCYIIKPVVGNFARQ